MSNPSTKAEPKRRWLQFSMRSMLVFVTLLCFALAAWVVPAERQRRAVAAIEALGVVEYASDEAASDSFLISYLRRYFPQAYFDDVESVNLASSSITDDGLAHLKGLRGLQELSLGNTQITGAGLAHLERLTGLQVLWLYNTQITDAGLANLEGLTKLRLLSLVRTQVTDAGLAHLEGLTALRSLLLGSPQVTDAGLATLRKALPNCDIR